MALETSGIDRYDKMPLLVNRWLTQIHLVVPGGLSTVAKAWRASEIVQYRSGGVRVPYGVPWRLVERIGVVKKMNSILHFVAKPS